MHNSNTSGLSDAEQLERARMREQARVRIVERLQLTAALDSLHADALKGISQFETAVAGIRSQPVLPDPSVADAVNGVRYALYHLRGALVDFVETQRSRIDREPS